MGLLELRGRAYKAAGEDVRNFGGKTLTAFISAHGRIVRDPVRRETRTGEGQGTAARPGAGEGSATRSGEGAGDAWRAGEGRGDALRAGEGKGDAKRAGKGKGDARGPVGRFLRKTTLRRNVQGTLWPLIKPNNAPRS